MKRTADIFLSTCVALLFASACAQTDAKANADAAHDGRLAGAWRSQIHFTSGPFAGANDLEFSYAYNAGGTMPESSNYDEAANSSPPAYGVWRQTSAGTFETKYLFYQTRAATPADGATMAGGWMPNGHGVLTESVTLSADGASYTSTINLASFDKSGKPTDGGGTGTATATRITF